MDPWYVAYRDGRGIVMKIAEDRTAAISAGSEMLRQGIDVTEVGPMLGHGDRLDATAMGLIVNPDAKRTA